MRHDLIQARRATTAQWTLTDPVLAAGEPGMDVQTGEVKFGDGVLTWSQILPLNPGSVLDRATNGAQETVTLAEADYTSLALPTFNSPSRPVEVVMFIPVVIHTIAAQTSQFKITNAANAVQDGGKAVGFVKSDAANGHDSAWASVWIPAGSGPQTLKVRRSGPASGVCQANLSGSSRATLTAYLR